MFKTLFRGGEILPVVSSGQWGGQAFETYKRTQTTDLLYMAGGGILAHPMGPKAGVNALQQAWEGAVKGLSIEETASNHKEFAASVKKFSK
ncbi:RuBisCO large subunit C-terminal-like domain-containing protein [Thalassobellus suaedae]|uniref:RuBisCO large subunit C-terminal-like domain-containing protein n=1 Tax=Thalassobellus suaedae TaxID=3074124 RepID=A0ABY9XZT9_9FLAO|nr:RuBisCO large subunit C-terminal-like domain-containing protein [Flavobacteriaceae bacterium HL-DH10]